MKKIPLVGKILIGFVLGTAIGLVLAECCAPETAKKVIPYVALCLGINPILDMFETCCNVTGDNVCTYIVAKKNGLLETGANR